MNSIQENGRSSYQAKTKAQLFEEVENLQKALQEKNIKVEELISELENLRKSESTSNVLQQKLEEKNSEAQHLIANLNEAQQGLKELQFENQSLQQTIQEIEEKNQSLENKLKAIHEEHVKKIKKLSDNLETSESQKQQLALKLKQLEKSVAEMKVTARLPEEASAKNHEYKGAKSTFRIEIYRRQGELLGRIEHPLSIEKASFTGVDEAKIMQFISNHLPVSEEPEKFTAVEQGIGPEITDFKIMLTSGRPLQHVLLKEQLYYFGFDFDSSGILINAENPIQFDISVFGKNIQGGAKLLLGETKLYAKNGNKHAIRINGVPIPAGAYRLELVIKSKYSDGTPAIYNMLAQTGFLYVK